MQWLIFFSEFTEGQTKIDHVLQRGAWICGSDHLRISRAGFCGLVYHFSTYSYQMLMTKTRRWLEIRDLSMFTLNICWYGIKIWIDDIYFNHDKDKIPSISNKLKTYEYVDYKYTGLFALFVWVIDSVGVSVVVTVTDIRWSQHSFGNNGTSPKNSKMQQVS